MHERNIVLLPSEVRSLNRQRHLSIVRPVTVISPDHSFRVDIDGRLWKVEGGVLWRYNAPKAEWVMQWPYGRGGDRLWVQETFCLESNCNVDSNNRYPPPFKDGRPVNWVEDANFGNYWEQAHYRATDPTPELDIGTDEPGVKWKPSSRMPRWASRFLLEITGIQIFRLSLLALKVPSEQWIEVLEKRFKKTGDEDPWAWLIQAKEVPHET